MKFKDFLNEEGFKFKERREAPRDAVSPAMRVFADHMFKIKRALDAEEVDVARRLVDGAIRSFQSAIKKDSV